jgi:hypothetical protein
MLFIEFAKLDPMNPAPPVIKIFNNSDFLKGWSIYLLQSDYTKDPRSGAEQGVERYEVDLVLQGHDHNYQSIVLSN